MIDELVSAIPRMKQGEELRIALTDVPEYRDSIRKMSEAERLIALSNLYDIYLPSEMSLEIYSKLYLALLRSLQKKGTKTAAMQQVENRKAIMQTESRGIIGGSDSFTIIGDSGIGKSSAINKSISLITENRIVELRDPMIKIIPCVVVQCPFDSSVKGLLLEILRKVDEIIDTKYCSNALRARATTDMLIGSVSQVALNHIGMLVVDEIQNVVNSKNGKILIGSLTQLINNSGISICMVGTPECKSFFGQAMQLARRSMGLNYGAMSYDDDFYNLCKTLWSYNYVQNDTEFTEATCAWLYEHSGGITSVVVSLIHDAQELAILTGEESLNLKTLNEAYRKRHELLHDFIQEKNEMVHDSTTPKTKRPRIPLVLDSVDIGNPNLIQELSAKSKKDKSDVVSILKKFITIEEVSV